MENLNTSNLVDELCELEPSDIKEIIAIEKKYNCKISCSTEKHNALQYTYFYEVDFNKDELFYIEIESGISNGTQVNNAEWGSDTKEDTKTARILKDIKLDCSFYEDGSLLKRKAQAILNANKSKLFEFYRKNNYDNYVTGGNSKMKLDLLLSKLHLDYIYENEEVDCNFI